MDLQGAQSPWYFSIFTKKSRKKIITLRRGLPKRGTPGSSFVGAGNAAAFSNKKFLGKIGLILANLVGFWVNLGKIKAKFGQNQNLVSQKHSISYDYTRKMNLLFHENCLKQFKTPYTNSQAI